MDTLELEPGEYEGKAGGKVRSPAKTPRAGRTIQGRPTAQASGLMPLPPSAQGVYDFAPQS